MIELTTLGGLDLRAGDGRAIGSVLAQPKRAGLLCYLAVARPGPFQRRDRLVALFWPEHDQESARHALRQSLHFLRRSLGEDVIVTRGDEEVGLNPERVRCDVVEFERRLEAGRPADAATLYRGELLPGFFLDGSAEFDEWLEQSRARLREQAADAALRAAHTCAAAGDAAGAGDWARRSVALAPAQEVVLRAALELLDAIGDRAGALRLHEDFIRQLAEEYGVEPSPETHRLVERIRSVRAEHSPAQLATSPAGQPPRLPELRGGRARRLGRAAVLLTLAAAVGALALRRPERAPAPTVLDSNLIAVLPFRIISADAEQYALGEGMVDLLAMRVHAETGVRTVEPRTLFAALQRTLPAGRTELSEEEALALTAQLGAGRLLLGSLIDAGGRITLSARLLDVPDGRIRNQAAVDGAPDELLVLLDRLSARLLSLAAGEPQDRLEALTTTSLPAMRKYLAGRSAQRQSRYAEAVQKYAEALDADSSFALAAMGILESGAWAGVPPGLLTRAVGLAWAARGRLSPHDALRLRVQLGADYPAATPLRRQIAFLENAVSAVPYDAELWYELGDRLYHDGQQVGLPGWRERAWAAFTRAAQLDSLFAPAQNHLFHLLLESGDIAGVGRVLTQYLERFPATEGVMFYRWLMASLARDSTSLARIRQPLFLDLVALPRIVLFSQWAGIPLDDAERAAVAFRERAVSAQQRQTARALGLQLLLNEGRPEAAQAWTSRFDGPAGAAAPGRDQQRLAIYHALYWDGSAAAAASAAMQLEARAPAAGNPDASARAAHYRDVCAAQQWRLSRGDGRHADRAIQTLRRAALPQDSADTVEFAQLCALLLAVLDAERQTGTAPAALLDRLDSLATVGPPTIGESMRLYFATTFTLARLREKAGDHGSALAVSRRRLNSAGAPLHLAPSLRLEGRLAALTGDTAGAIRAYRHYLALRADPEPALRPQRDSVRAALDALLRRGDTAARR